MDNIPWIGVDLDGTLAYYDGWKGKDHIGDPIPSMLYRVKKWVDEGVRVKIFTARACIPDQIPPVHQWLVKQNLPKLEVTCSKDLLMLELWDDRCVQVVSNGGVAVQDLLHPVIRCRVKSAREEHHTDTVDPTPVDMGGGWKKVGASLVNKAYSIDVLFSDFHVQMDSHNKVARLVYTGSSPVVKHIIQDLCIQLVHTPSVNANIQLRLLHVFCRESSKVLRHENV